MPDSLLTRRGVKTLMFGQDFEQFGSIFTILRVKAMKERNGLSVLVSIQTLHTKQSTFK